MLFVLDHTSPDARYIRSLFTIVTRCELFSGFSQQILLVNRLPFLLSSLLATWLVLDSLSICLLHLVCYSIFKVLMALRPGGE